jgi:outer membrane receptor protein involved in Fe transport
VLDVVAQPALEGKRLAQVPEQTATVGVRFDRPGWFTAGLTVRYVGGQFEDDLNILPLGSYPLVDVYLGRAITRWAEVFVAIENVLDRTYAVGRSSEGVVSIGGPRLFRGGARVTGH